jgi:hypothetical protein
MYITERGHRGREKRMEKKYKHTKEKKLSTKKKKKKYVVVV